jgi:hypothetical protein
MIQQIGALAYGILGRADEAVGSMHASVAAPSARARRGCTR